MANAYLALVSPVADAGVAHFLDTASAYTSGTLQSWRANGAEKASVDFEGSFAGKNSTLSGILSVDDTTDSTSTTSGSIHTDGGVGIALDLFVGDDLTLVSDAAVLNFGVNSDVSLTHVHDTGLLLNGTMQLQFNDSTQYISGTSATVLSIAATDEIDLTATAVDLNGTLDVSGTSQLTGAVTTSADVGIGTAPSNRLHVKETGMTGWLAKLEGNNTSANDVTIEMCYSGSGGGANSGMGIAMDYATGTSDYVLLCSSGGSPRFKVNASGLVHVSGELTAGTKTFRIDHPLEDKKDTHQLVHSCIEAPKADLIYRGTINLSGGSAQVDLDEAAGMSAGTWELLCRDPQCWIQNDSGWDAVRGSVEENTLTIECAEASSSDTVSWMVVAERQDEVIKGQDATDNEGHLIVEPEKTSP